MAEKEVLKADEDTDEIVVVETPPVTEPKPEASSAEPVTSAEDSHGDDDDDEDEHSNLRADEDREDIRERRRKEKAERKARRDAAIKRDKIELEFLRKQNDTLERRISAQESRSQQQDASVIDHELQRALNEVSMAEKVIAKAIQAQNGEDAAQAMRLRDQAIARAQALNQRKAQFSQEKAASSILPDVAQKAQKFISDNKWYDPKGADEDSAIVLAIDNAMVREGFNPASDAYWEELNKRVKRRLPEKFADSHDGTGARQPKGGPALGSGRDGSAAAGSGRREFYVSPERKQALIDAGVWDDPVLRTKYVKKYMEYDKQNRA